MNKDMIKDIMDVVSIPSVYNPKGTPGAPFGTEVAKCLDKVLEIGEKLGYKTVNYDGYVGELNMGNGPDIIGVLGHCDVVAAGEGWDTEPFEPILKDNKIYGRGSADDKGPLIACLYGVKELKDQGKIPENITVRVIVGTNEEEDWEDIPHYLEKVENLPMYSIVPDAEFPLIYCEKGLYDIDIVSKYSKSDSKLVLREFTGGSARNAVAAKAVATIEVSGYATDEIASILEKEFENKNISGTVSTDGNKINILVTGKNAHAMNPEKGINAGANLIKLLSALDEYDFSHKDFVQEFRRLIDDDYTGKRCGLDCMDEDSGALTLNVGTYALNESGNIRLQLSIRYPASLDFDDIREKTLKSLNTDTLAVVEITDMKPVSFNRDDEFIELLMKTYQDITHDFESEPMSIGGATYARVLPNAVAFGPIFPYETELAHEPNEFIDLESLEKAKEIYTLAIERICEKFKK